MAGTIKLINECRMFVNQIHDAELDKRTVDARMLRIGLRAYVTLTGEGSNNPDVHRLMSLGTTGLPADWKGSKNAE